MKTETYNPSPLEVELTNSLLDIREKLNHNLSSIDIVEMKADLDLDNPMLHISARDHDGDVHEFVIKVIQRPDKH